MMSNGIARSYQFILLVCWARLARCASAESGGKSAFEVGASALSDYPLQVTSLLIGVITVAVIAELIVENLKHSINDAFQRILDAVINEVMILGIVSIVLFLLEDTKAWADAEIDGDPVDVTVVHFIHMALFLVALLYIFSNISLIVLMKRTADRWSSWEAFCIEDERSMNSSIKEHQRSNDTPNMEDDINFMSHRGSEGDVMSHALRDMLIDMDTRLKVYTDWRSSASFFDLVKNMSKVMKGNELKRAVQFRHIRSFFLSQGRRRNSIADIEHILHNRFRFSNFLYRCAVQDLNKCSSIGIKVWVFLGMLIGIDALRIEVQILAYEGHNFHPNPLHDIYYWISVQYVVFFFLIYMNFVVKKAWSVFKQQNETAVRISQKLRRSVTDKTIREVVRKKMLEKEIRIIKAEEFQKLFLFNSPEMTFTFIKIGVMVCCWTIMLYILGYSKKIWDGHFLHPGEAFLITFVYLLPTVFIFWFIIPDTIGIMSILMSARDLSLATPQEKKTLVELMRISMSESLTLFKSKRRRRSSMSVLRASEAAPPPMPGHGPAIEGEADEVDQRLRNESMQKTHKPFGGSLGSNPGNLHIDTESESKEADSSPYSPTVIYSETPHSESSTSSKIRQYLPKSSPSPQMKARKTLSSVGSRPISMPLHGSEPIPAPSKPVPLSRLASQRRRGSMANMSMVDLAKSFIRDRIVLSESEATVERIRSYTGDTGGDDDGEDEDEVREWEQTRRRQAFARYGEMTPQIAGNLELSHIPMVRSRSMSRDVAGATANTFGSPNPMSRKSSAPAMSVMASSPIGYRPVAAVVEGNESEGESSSDEDQEDVKVLYGSRPDESGELENIELSDAVLSRQAYASLQHGSSLFREVSTNEDPASVGEADSVDFDDAERIIRENNLEILLQSSERTKALI